MPFNRLIALLPCYGLESFDFHQNEADSEQLYAAWTALWHPTLIKASGSVPRWNAALNPPLSPTGQLIVVPECCEATLPDDWLVQAEEAGASLIRRLTQREAILAKAFELLSEPAPAVDSDLVADFFALGLCHFQVELLTRKLRYMSMLDESGFQTATLAAAEETLNGNTAAAREQLQKAFDRLHEAREYFYPTEPSFLDITLAAPTTLGKALQAELTARRPTNLLISGATLDEMASREPATLAVLQEAIRDNRTGIVGGEEVEIPLPLLAPETIEAHLCRGLAIYERILGRRPDVFGRRLFGLGPVLPQVLKRLGFSGVFHCTLDDGQFPTSNKSPICWQGIDGTTINAVAKLPTDVGRAESLFQFTEALGNALNYDPSSVLLFAHWPGRTHSWYSDFRRIGAYGSVLGKYQTIAAYLAKETFGGHQGIFRADQYRSPYLAQEVAADRCNPITRWATYYRCQAFLETCHALGTMGAVCGSTEKGHPAEERKADLSRLAEAVENTLSTDSPMDSLKSKLDTAMQQSLSLVAQAFSGRSTSDQRGSLVVNPWSFSQQAIVASTPLDVPAMGFAWSDTTESAPLVEVRKGWFGRKKRQEPLPLVVENTLQNEYFQVHFDPQTGAIRSIADYHTRAPRLAQQIAMRLPQGNDPDADVNYTIMAADEFKVTSNGPRLGEIVCRGRLMSRQGQCVARFCQTTRAWRGCRILDVQVDLDIDRLPDANPWNSYYAMRFAWKDQAAAIYRNTNWAVLPTDLTRFESPLFVEIRSAKHRTALLTDGLPYHRRLGSRKLDTLLVVQGETSRSFRCGIGIDVPHPLSTALARIAPPCVLADQPRPTTMSGWLFHLDCRNVQATQWEPILAEKSQKISGFRVCLLETDGRGVRLGLRSVRQVAKAEKLNPGNVPPLVLQVEGDRVEIPLGPHQMTDVEVFFA